MESKNDLTGMHSDGNSTELLNPLRIDSFDMSDDLVR